MSIVFIVVSFFWVRFLSGHILWSWLHLQMSNLILPCDLKAPNFVPFYALLRFNCLRFSIVVLFFSDHDHFIDNT
jgi:hypothetical protein